MKNLLLVLALMVIGTSIFAQHKRDTVGFAGKRTEKRVKLKEELDLTPKQVREIREIHKTYKDKLEAVKADSSLNGEQRKATRQQLLLERQQKTDSLLTPEQRLKARELMQKRNQKKGKHHKEEFEMEEN